MRQASNKSAEDAAKVTLRTAVKDQAETNKHVAEDNMCKRRFDDAVLGSIEECFQDQEGKTDDSCVLVSKAQSSSTSRKIRDDQNDKRVYDRNDLQNEMNVVRPHFAQCRSENAEGITWQAVRLRSLRLESGRM